MPCHTWVWSHIQLYQHSWTPGAQPRKVGWEKPGLLKTVTHPTKLPDRPFSAAKSDIGSLHSPTFQWLFAHAAPDSCLYWPQPLSCTEHKEILGYCWCRCLNEPSHSMPEVNSFQQGAEEKEFTRMWILNSLAAHQLKSTRLMYVPESEHLNGK